MYSDDDGVIQFFSDESSGDAVEKEVQEGWGLQCKPQIKDLTSQSLHLTPSNRSRNLSSQSTQHFQVTVQGLKVARYIPFIYNITFIL